MNVVYILLVVGAAAFYLGLRDVLRSRVWSGGYFAEKVEMMTGPNFALAVLQILAGLVMTLVAIFQLADLANLSDQQLRYVLYIGAGTLAGTLIVGVAISAFSGSRKKRR
jgi:hypothetical protein